MFILLQINGDRATTLAWGICFYKSAMGLWKKSFGRINSTNILLSEVLYRRLPLYLLWTLIGPYENFTKGSKFAKTINFSNLNVTFSVHKGLFSTQMRYPKYLKDSIRKVSHQISFVTSLKFVKLFSVVFSRKVLKITQKSRHFHSCKIIEMSYDSRLIQFYHIWEF